MTSKPNVIVVQKSTGKGTTIQGLPGKNVVTTLLNAGVSSSIPVCLSIQSFDSKKKSNIYSVFLQSILLQLNNTTLAFTKNTQLD